MCKRQSHWLVLAYYRPCFDLSKSVRAKADNVINIHESSSSLILSAFYIVLSRIYSMIIILSVLLIVPPPHFFQKHRMTKKAPPPVLSSVKITNVHSHMPSFNSNY